jgi:long-chain acyl-CoA synthetase
MMRLTTSGVYGSSKSVANISDLSIETVLERARANPGEPALVGVGAGVASGDAGVVTIGELARRARRVARGLVALGAGPGARVALVSRPRAEWVVCDLACQLAGLVVVPLYKNELPAQLRAALELAECRFAFAEDPWQARKLLDAAVGLAWRLEIVMFDERIVMQHGGELHFGELGAERPRLLAEVDALGATAPRPDPLDERREGIVADACTAIAMTADSNGRMRGVMVTHANLTAAANALRDGYDVLHRLHQVREPRHLLGIPLASTLGRSVVWANLSAGIPVGLPRTHTAFAEDARAFRPTHLTVVPGILERARVAIERARQEGRGVAGAVRRWAAGVRTDEGLLDRWRSNLSRRHLRLAVRERFGSNCLFAVSTGAPLGEGTAAFLAAGGLVVREGWGAVETVGLTHLDVSRTADQGIGTPLGDVEYRIGHDGELFVRGAMVSPGYWRDAEATATSIDAEGWLATGDLAHPLMGGGLAITGRKRDIIVLIDGRTVAPRPIEQALAGDELIAEAVVYGDKRPFVVALVSLDPTELERLARAQQLGGTADAWLRHPAVYARVEAAVARVNAALPPHAHVRKFAILNRGPVDESEELSTTNYLRRGVVGRKYHSLLETFYAEPF